jgi:hypothetical protein
MFVGNSKGISERNRRMYSCLSLVGESVEEACRQVESVSGSVGFVASLELSLRHSGPNSLPQEHRYLGSLSGLQGSV